ncbi:MAG: flagellar protein FlaG [Ruminiclostridium sp.]|nr:flagellar protein FlaG [Ruminiclostridium sp.]
MRIEGTDAASRAVDFKIERSAEAITSQKITHPENGKSLTDESNQAAVSEKMVMSAIEKANKIMLASGRSLEISVHESTKKIMVKVIDTKTDEVIREIPPEKLVDLIANLMELAGIIVDERR